MTCQHFRATLGRDSDPHTRKQPLRALRLRSYLSLCRFLAFFALQNAIFCPSLSFFSITSRHFFALWWGVHLSNRAKRKPTRSIPRVFQHFRTLPFSVSCNSFVCHSYENCQGVYQFFPFWFTQSGSCEGHSLAQQTLIPFRKLPGAPSSFRRILRDTIPLHSPGLFGKAPWRNRDFER